MAGLFTQNMTPQQVAMLVGSGAPPEQMADMPHETLYQAREYVPGDQQKLIAPYEHRAFARQYVYEHPIAGSIGLLGAIPGYQAYKVLTGQARSEPSLQQVTQGLAGIKDGLMQRLKEIQQNVYYRDPFGDSTK